MKDEHERALSAAMDGASSGWGIHLGKDVKRWLMNEAIQTYLSTMRESGYQLVKLDRDGIARAIQLEDADCFPTLNLKKTDYCERLADAIITMLKGGEDE